MAKGLNKCCFIGNLGQDPEIRYTQDGKAVANFSMACSEEWKKDGQKQERTEWVKIVIWGKLAEVAGEFLKKGSKVYVEGKLQTRKWQNKEGQDQYTTEINVHDLLMLDGRSTKPEQNEPQGQEPMSGDLSDDIPFNKKYYLEGL